MSQIYLECVEGGSAKFWQCKVAGSSATITFGKIGTSGQSQTKDFATPQAANDFAAKQRNLKMQKGYVAKGKQAAAKAGVAKAEAKAKGKAGAKASAKAGAKAAARAEPRSPAKRTAEAPAAASPAKAARSSSAGASPAKAARSSSKGGKGKSVDSMVPNASSLSVYEDYSIKLNQTHIDANNNKFYIIQALEGNGAFWAWNRWGRVGDPGQNKLMKFTSADAAIKEFSKKFREKTGNAWENVGSFKPINGKYTIVETEDGGGADSAPMGKLTEAQIKKGQAVLEKLKAELKKSKSNETTLDTLSSEFYSLIPHNFGWKRPPGIKTDKMLEEKVELLKFYLRMGFDNVEDKKTLSPIEGVLDLPVPPSLDSAAKGICQPVHVQSSLNSAEQLASKKAGKPAKSMTKHHYGAILLYTGNAIYTELNKALRDENRTKVRKYFNYLRLFFDAMDCLPKQRRTLWRGISVDLYDHPQYAVGKTVTWWGVSSTTSDKSVAQNFAASCGKCTMLTLEAKTAADISALSFYSNEKESLLLPGTMLKVKSKKRNGDVTEITVEEVGNALK